MATGEGGEIAENLQMCKIVVVGYKNHLRAKRAAASCALPRIGPALALLNAPSCTFAC